MITANKTLLPIALVSKYCIEVIIEKFQGVKTHKALRGRGSVILITAECAKIHLGIICKEEKSTP